jgi:ATP-dependent helicase HrpB
MRLRPKLPIDAVEEEILATVRTHGALVLTAPTGSGKTTQVPQMLLRDGVEGQILVLQPRRLAARVVAQRVAEELGCELGDLVGFQTRHERKVSGSTRILFLTEGLFLRILLTNPELTGVGAVVLDEFHERSLAVDLALGLCNLLRAGPRPDLRLVVMSATLDADAVATFLDCPSLRAKGRTYDVSIEYDTAPTDTPVWERAGSALRRWLDEGGEGDALLFLPGTYEIRRTVEACQRRLRSTDGAIAVLPLHGSLSPSEQDRAVRPGSERKVVVSTNVAETSITIDGIRCVIDSGLARVHRHDPARSVNALLVERVSLDSAEQRSGRAGRTAPGICIRLWPGSEAHARPVQDIPEVQRVDLCEAVLQIHAFGLKADSFPWLDPPPVARLQAAASLLADLGAVDVAGALTDEGRLMVDVPAHPRLARLLLEGSRRGVGDRAAVWAALVAERDICMRPLARQFCHPPDVGSWPSDVGMRESAYESARQARFSDSRCRQLGVHAGACREVERAVRQYRAVVKHLPRPTRAAGDESDAALARCVLAGYADHVALRRSVEHNTCEMEGRRRVTLERSSAVGDARTLVVVEAREVEAPRVDGGGVRTVISLATAIDPAWIGELFPDRIETRKHLVWDEEECAVFEVEGVYFGALALQSSQRVPTDRSAAGQLLASHVVSGSLRFDQWNKATDTWLSRARCVAEWFPERDLLTYDEDDLAVIFNEAVGESTRWSVARRAPILDHLRNAMSWAEQQFVEQMAPERIRLPSGHGMKISYTPGEAPRGRARIQDFYGLNETPRIAGKRTPLLLEILAPNFRPAQVTDDLQGFWQRTYPELRRELSRRYPKHEWR